METVNGFVYINDVDIFIIVGAEEFSLVISVKKCIISDERFVLELPISRAMLATARPSCVQLAYDRT